MRNAYDLLQLGSDSDDSKIKERFRQLMLVYHPDKSNRTNLRGNPEDAPSIEELIEARDLLLDPSRRKQLDLDIQKNEQSISISTNEILLSQLIQSPDGAYYFTCRCGDKHELSQEDLDDGVNYSTCNSCSLSIFINHDS